MLVSKTWECTSTPDRIGFPHCNAMFADLLWNIIGAQIPTYFISASLSFITADIGGAEAAAWLPVSIGLATAAVSSFCGYLQDLFGRRAITLIGGILLVVGTIVMGTAHHFRQGVVAAVLIGAGSAIAELTALAGYVLGESPDGLIIKLIVDFWNCRVSSCEQAWIFPRHRHRIHIAFRPIPLVC
jgi:MFS family permease